MTVVTDSDVVERLESLEQGDRAPYRTNPFAISADTLQLVTADEVSVAELGRFGLGFTCPSCRGELRYCVNQRMTPFFAHASSRGDCKSGFETPAHLCIKRGLESIGLTTEHKCEVTGLRYDAFDSQSGQAVEVVCTGFRRYLVKVAKTNGAGVQVNWIFDSAAKGLATKFGQERIVHPSQSGGTIITEGFFLPKVRCLLSAIPCDRLFMFYRGLIWRSVGPDRWQLLDESHPFNVAATCDGGMKHLMVQMKVANAHVIAKKQLSRRTWFEQKFRYRGDFSMTWRSEREYIEEEISRLISDLQQASNYEAACRQGKQPHSEPSRPRHASIEEIVRKVTDRHSIAVNEIRQLRMVVEKTRSESPQVEARLSEAKPTPLVIDLVSNVQSSRRIVSSRWKPHQPSVHQINRMLDEAAQQKRCACGSTSFSTKRYADILYDICVSCGASKKLGKIKQRTGVTRRRSNAQWLDFGG